MIGAGAVVCSDAPDYALMLGVPARRREWVSRHAHVLKFDKFGNAVCPESKLNYKLHNNHVECIDLNEDDPLPNNLKNGVKPYAEFK